MIDFLRNAILRDVWLKLFSLALAVLIWLTVTFVSQKGGSPLRSLNPSIAERTLPGVPVLIVSSAENVRDFRVSPKEVTVTVRGDKRSLDALRYRDVRAMVDLTGIESARELRKRIEVSTPAGITYLQVKPQEVEIIFPDKAANR
jgi:YbbR domain-containing protein